MDTLTRLGVCRRMLLAVVRPQHSTHSTGLALHVRQRLESQHLSTTLSRHASSTAGVPPKTIVLEPPDKFRPPSHPQRLSKRPPKQYPGPPLSENERKEQKTKQYPRMFPNEGSTMHWFLTNKWIHIWITMGTLTFLAIITLSQDFIHTSPFAHLLPPFSQFPFHPFSTISECISIYKMHVNYRSERVAESRRQKILDAQKQRLYRRAHGMEDLNAEEESGIDVRGLVPWDDGLTKKERAAGGRSEHRSGRMVLEAGGKVGDPLAPAGTVEGDRERKAMEEAIVGAKDDSFAQPKRKIKRWLGIWE